MIRVILLALGLAGCAHNMAPPTTAQGAAFDYGTACSGSCLMSEDTFTETSLNTTFWNPFMSDAAVGDRWNNGGLLPSPYSSTANSPGGNMISYGDPYNYGFATPIDTIHMAGGSGVLSLTAALRDASSRFAPRAQTDASALGQQSGCFQMGQEAAAASSTSRTERLTRTRQRQIRTVRPIGSDAVLINLIGQLLAVSMLRPATMCTEWSIFRARPSRFGLTGLWWRRSVFPGARLILTLN